MHSVQIWSCDAVLLCPVFTSALTILVWSCDELLIVSAVTCSVVQGYWRMSCTASVCVDVDDTAVSRVWLLPDWWTDGRLPSSPSLRSHPHVPLRQSSSANSPPKHFSPLTSSVFPLLFVCICRPSAQLLTLHKELSQGSKVRLRLSLLSALCLAFALSLSRLSIDTPSSRLCCLCPCDRLISFCSSELYYDSLFAPGLVYWCTRWSRFHTNIVSGETLDI